MELDDFKIGQIYYYKDGTPTYEIISIDKTREELRLKDLRSATQHSFQCPMGALLNDIEKGSYHLMIKTKSIKKSRLSFI